MLAFKEVNNGYTHAENLHVFIDDCLKEAKLQRQDLNAVVVGKGPGSYTGLRIGVSAAKGIAYALNIPLLSMNTLLNMTVAAKKQCLDDVLFCPMLDARRMEVYTALFDINLKEKTATHSLIITPESLDALSKNNKIILFGDGASKCKEAAEGKNNISIIENIFPSALNMIDYGIQQLEAKNYEDVAYFEPFYLKEFYTGAKQN